MAHSTAEGRPKEKNATESLGDSRYT